MHHITLELFSYELVFDPVRFLRSAIPTAFSTSPSRSSSFHFFWTASPPSTFSLLTEKKLSTDLEDAFVRFKLFWDAMMDTHELLRYYKNQFEAIGWFEKIHWLIFMLC